MATQSRVRRRTPRIATSRPMAIFGMTIPVPQALIQMTLFLGALTFMYLSARSVGDGEFRSRFLDPLIDDLKLMLLARNRYRHSSAGQSEPAGPSDPP